MAEDKNEPTIQVRLGTAACNEVADLIRGAKEGLLHNSEVLEWARNNKNSSTYKWLERHDAFNTKRAAEKYALLLCGKLIRKVKVLLAPGEGQPAVLTRLAVSCPVDRTTGGGYRDVEKVLASQAMRGELYRAALMDLRSFQQKYGVLSQLTPVLKGIEAFLVDQRPNKQPEKKEGEAPAA